MIPILFVAAATTFHWPPRPAIAAQPPPSAMDSPTCYANCDNSTTVPWLNVNDFVCYLNLFATGDTRANCNFSTQPPVLNVNDFICFNENYAAGCSAP